MVFLVKAAQLILSLSILVIIHEFGHFIFARIFKTRVEKFYLFFDPWFSLFKFKRGETEYGVGWIPLGGYVKISGMIDESMDKEAMKQEPKPWEFRSKPSGQRLLIMLGGVLFNVLFAFLIYSMVLMAWGEKYLPLEEAKYGIVCDSLALDMGLQHGDKILTLDHQTIEDFDDLIPQIVYKGAQSIQVDRQGEKIDIPVPDNFVAEYLQLMREKKGFIYIAFPFVAERFEKGSPAEQSGMKPGDRLMGFNGSEYPYFYLFAMELQKHAGDSVNVLVEREGQQLSFPMLVPETGKIGVYPVAALSFFNLKEIRYSFFQSIPAGVSKGVKMISSYLKDLKLIFSPETKAYKSVGGFIAIGNIFPSSWNWLTFWNMTAFLSIMLAVVNILPIPALDGGHVLFLLFEIITGRKPGEKFMEVAQIIGMLVLLSLVIYANGNDILKLFTK
ncbi:MAG: RIP metalloprotease RseP [Bacteroidales bacterium]|nr:RIP metalloprotease RseP [Bacteroidales bacterium]MDD2812081.1 RIP metalloprotease RseP [Bacteroidales bacterium]MDD3384634.1 RIP metalloprotease RseP [Bacteroidales bacterium]MDD3870743.1 RIP metalloprotease RseP [Bacteroidales bacterium]